MNFDAIVKELGEFGRYQKILYFIICLPGISCGIVMTFAVILLGEPVHRYVVLRTRFASQSRNKLYM